ncbi:hypothetical protein KKD52_02370 [Myxococcota bacterium]|nr:hypothetical protein [Myxococcota bacterium]MBU1410551.1 hypothetical protein [Myxococcota bacterium]MBU1509180.1 hypothetical protein [Myxococcota bacterium]PKN24095.1 MAG: hypothetical protein CVU65_12715 [Deltaproteobacteria bacterium HGW-Deltaproteobacteria-22]
MSQLIHTLDFAGSAQDLFESFLRHFRARDYHIEEADAVGMRLHAEKTRGLFSKLFGIGTLHVHVQFMDDDTVQVRLSSAGAGTILDELKALAAKNKPAVVPAPAAPPVVSQVILREIVKIPCRFCGSLIENTQTRCPYCGGE